MALMAISLSTSANISYNLTCWNMAGTKLNGLGDLPGFVLDEFVWLTSGRIRPGRPSATTFVANCHGYPTK